jgi:hypothetical protein
MAWKKILTATEGSPYGASVAQEHVSPFDLSEGYVTILYTQFEQYVGMQRRFFKTTTASDTYEKVLKYYTGRCVNHTDAGEAAAGLETLLAYETQEICEAAGHTWMETGLYWAPDLDSIFAHPGSSETVGGITYPGYSTGYGSITDIETDVGSCADSTSVTQYECEVVNGSSWTVPATNGGLEPFVQYTGTANTTNNKHLVSLTKKHASNTLGHTVVPPTWSHTTGSLSLYNLELGYPGTVPGGTNWNASDTMTSGTLALDANKYVHSETSQATGQDGELINDISLLDPRVVFSGFSIGLTADSEGHVATFTPPSGTQRDQTMNQLSVCDTLDTTAPWTNEVACLADGGTWELYTGVDDADRYDRFGLLAEMINGNGMGQNYITSSLATVATEYTRNNTILLAPGDSSDLITPSSLLYGEPFVTASAELTTTTDTDDTLTYTVNADYGSGGRIKDLRVARPLFLSTPADITGNWWNTFTGAEHLFYYDLGGYFATPTVHLKAPYTPLSSYTTNALASDNHTHKINAEWNLGTDNTDVYDSSTEAEGYGSGTWTPTLIRSRKSDLTDGPSNNAGELKLFNVVVSDEFLHVGSTASLGTIVHEFYEITADYSAGATVTFSTYSAGVGSSPIFSSVDRVTYGSSLTLTTDYTVASNGDITLVGAHSGGELSIEFGYITIGETQFLTSAVDEAGRFPISVVTDATDDPYCMHADEHTTDGGGTDWTAYENVVDCLAAEGRWSRYAVTSWASVNSGIVFAHGESASNSYQDYTDKTTRVWNSASGDDIIIGRIEFQETADSGATWSATRKIIVENIGKDADGYRPNITSTGTFTSSGTAPDTITSLTAGDVIIGTVGRTPASGSLSYESGILRIFAS